MQKKITIKSLFKNPNLNNNGLTDCPVCGDPQFDENIFPGSEEICSICGWQDDLCQYSDHDLEESSNVVSLNQAKENYRFCGTTDLTRLDRIRDSILLGLIYGLELEKNKSSFDRIAKDKFLWYYLEKIIGELYNPRFPYDDLDILKTLTNKFYEEDEVSTLHKFAIAFKNFIERVGIEQADEIYTSDQQWPDLQKQAASLVELMQKNNYKYHFDKPYIPKQLGYLPL